MDWDDETVWCDGCGAEITWNPILAGKRRFCCKDCLEGRPCRCAERIELDDDRRPSASLPSYLSGSYSL